MAQGLKDLIADAASRVKRASVQDVKEQQDRGEVDFLLDVRDRHEFDAAHVHGATNISRGLLEIRAAADSPSANEMLTSNTDARIVTYCTKAPGLRSLMAADTLTKLGYTNVVAMEGGLDAWAESGFEVDEA
jgi:rhodanese-related sulfurtransferase